MSVANQKANLPQGFDGPTALPQSPNQHHAWQEANRAWWEANPMRYDFSESLVAVEFSREFYQEIDRRFFSDVRTFMPWSSVPFDPLLNFESLKNKDVLEVGVGSGSHGQLIAPHCGSYTGIDLTDYAIKSTSKRFQQFLTPTDLNRVRLRQMDAEEMDFANDSFDLIWSWGVIHHSAHTRKILEEFRRVLKPGGTAVIMVYHRSFWNYYVMSTLSGLARGNSFERFSFHVSRQKMIDGAIARYYTVSEWKALSADLLLTTDVRVYGSKAELIPLPSGKLKQCVRAIIPDCLSRFLTNRCRMGMYLVSVLRKDRI